MTRSALAAFAILCAAVSASAQTIYIQAESPGADKESDWLPSPKAGEIGPTMRIYSPRPEALDGSWVPPALTRVQ